MLTKLNKTINNYHNRIFEKKGSVKYSIKKNSGSSHFTKTV